MDVVIEPKSVIDRSTDLGFTYIKVENMEAMKVSGCGRSMDSEKSSTIVQQPTKKSFSRVVKALFFETTLVSLYLLQYLIYRFVVLILMFYNDVNLWDLQAKRVRDRKGFKQHSGKSKLSSSLMTKNRSMDLESFELLNTTILSSTTSESKVSSKSNLSKLVKQNHKYNAEKYFRESEMDHYGFNSGLYLLLISLIVTVLWGRFWAVVFTSIWLYFLPAWSTRNRWPENEKKWPEKESTAHKKKVIMEGLLERNHIRRGH